MKRLVLVGGGHAHVHVLKSFAEAPDAGTALTLVTPVARQVYSGMLPGFVAGHYPLAACGISLEPLARRAGATVAQGSAVRLDTARREVVLDDGSALAYDVVSLNVGSQPRTAGVAGAGEHAIAVRPLERFVAGWEAVLARARAGSPGAISVVGGGAGAVELAFAMDWRLRSEIGPSAPHVRILTDAPALLMDQRPSVRARVARLARERGIGVHEGSAVTAVGPDVVTVRGSVRFATGSTFWVAGASAPAFIAASGLATDERGFLAVDECLQSRSHPGVFGAGDCAGNPEHPGPKAGDFAVRAGPALAANLRAALAGGKLVPHGSRRRFLALIACGGRYALGTYGPLSFEGGWVWRWKDRIDRRFLARYAPA